MNTASGRDTRTVMVRLAYGLRHHPERMFGPVRISPRYSERRPMGACPFCCADASHVTIHVPNVQDDVTIRGTDLRMRCFDCGGYWYYGRPGETPT